METWNKFALSLLRHPKLRSFRAPARIKVLEFLELSVRYEPRGLVSFLDDEIALDLNVPLHHWLGLRDGMVERGIIRQLATPGGLVYEVAFWVLPDQSNANGSIRDGRSLEPWEALPAEAIDSYAEDRDSSVDLRTAKQRQNERTEKSRFRAKIRREENRYPSPAETAAHIDEYRAKREAKRRAIQEAGNGSAVSETLQDLGLETVTDDVTLQNGVTATTTDETLLEERDNNSFEMGGAGVTPNGACNAVTGVTALQAVTAVSREAEKAVVVALLTDVSTDHALPMNVALALIDQPRPDGKDGLEVCRRQLMWLPFRRVPKPDQGTRGGQLRRAIVEDWAEPKESRQASRDAARAEAARRQREVMATTSRAAAEQEEVRQFRREQWWRALSDVEREALDRQAEGRLPDVLRSRAARARERGEPLALATRVAVESERWLMIDALINAEIGGDAVGAGNGNATVRG